MKSEDLEHVLRAAANVLGESDFLVIGSAAILASYPDATLPPMATRSDEADLAPFSDPDGLKADQVDGAIGEGSVFHITNGYYAQGVGFDTARLPSGWQGRLITFESAATQPGRGHCLEAHDLAASKLVAGRPKDFEFVGALADVGLLDLDLLTARIEAIPLTEVHIGSVSRALKWVRSRQDRRA